MAITEEEMDKQAQKNAKLRDQIADANAQREARERELSREVEMAQLKAEEERLTAALAEAKEHAKATAVKSGAADLMETVTTGTPPPVVTVSDEEKK